MRLHDYSSKWIWNFIIGDLVVDKNIFVRSGDASKIKEKNKVEITTEIKDSEKIIKKKFAFKKKSQK